MAELNYCVTGSKGYRKGNLTLSAAKEHAAKLKGMGWGGTIKIFYCDGTEVDGSGRIIGRRTS